MKNKGKTEGGVVRKNQEGNNIKEKQKEDQKDDRRRTKGPCGWGCTEEPKGPEEPRRE